MGLRTGLVAGSLSALVSLGGAVAAMVVVVVLAVAAPDMVEAPAFFWGSAVVMTMLQGLLAFAGARLAMRRLYGADDVLGRGRALWVACTGPVLVTVLIQLGIAAGGRFLLAMAPVCAALIGGVLGARAVSRTAAGRVRSGL